MKLFTKTSLLIAVLVFMGFGSSIIAADLMVAENGAGGAYASITEAIAASVDDDRIIITPKSGGAAYGEDLSISKSLQFLCAYEGQQFTMQGNITLSASNGMEVTFIGMNNLAGGINGVASVPAGNRCNVNIMNCNFVSGNVNFDYDNFKLNLVSSVINGTVSLRYGKVIGNQITNTGTTLSINTDAYPTNDTIWIVANKITSYYVATNYWALFYANTSQFFYISNNFIAFDGNYNYSSYYNVGIHINANKDSSVGKNTIMNNTIQRIDGGTGSSSRNHAIYVANTPANTIIEMANNLILGTASNTITNGLLGLTNSGVVSSSYTYMNSFVTTPFNGISDDGTNSVVSNTTIDSEGLPAGGSDCIDAGNADSVYYDIDLTRNDIGCYGGSFTMDNYFPITGAARVYFMLAPRRITVGNTLNIRAESFDR